MCRRKPLTTLTGKGATRNEPHFGEKEEVIFPISDPVFWRRRFEIDATPERGIN